MKLKHALWILICILMFILVALLWIRRVKEGLASSTNAATQSDAKDTKNHSKNVGSIEEDLDALDDILTPIYNRVSISNTEIRVVTEKEPKLSYSSPDITLMLESPEDLTPTMHIVLPQGKDGEDGEVGEQGEVGPTGAPGPQGPSG